MKPFAYTGAPQVRRHGPEGYSEYESYRPWLRDEFAFRCVYCLARERWHKGEYGFQVDHVIPRSEAPARTLDYDNLAYACQTCNEMKSDAARVPNPCEVGYGGCLEVHDDGTISALSTEGEFLIRVLRLDNAENTEFRRLILDVIHLARQRDPGLYARLMGFPDDLPDLTRKRPPRGNSRPKGVGASWHARRARNELPETY
jgi:hypothetical protein